MRTLEMALLGLVTMGLMSGCQKAAAPLPTAQDVEAAKQDAKQEVEQARAEASKDVKSAAKVSGSDSKVVSEAKVTGTYDVTMAKADGDHKVATEQCLTLTADQQQSCKDQADADYQTTAAAAKTTRQARR